MSDAATGSSRHDGWAVIPRMDVRTGEEAAWVDGQRPELGQGGLDPGGRRKSTGKPDAGAPSERWRERREGRVGRAQPLDAASGFEDGDDAKSLLRLGGKEYLYSYVPYCRLAFAFQSKRPRGSGFGGADLGVLGGLECRFFMLS